LKASTTPTGWPLTLVMSGVPEGALPVTLLDVDDATRGLGRGPATPHAALAVRSANPSAMARRRSSSISI
jgi:hypothetical protein